MVWQGATSLGCVEDQWQGGGGDGGAHWVGPRLISGTLRKLHRAYFVDCTEVVPLSRRPDSSERRSYCPDNGNEARLFAFVLCVSAPSSDGFIELETW